MLFAAVETIQETDQEFWNHHSVVFAQVTSLAVEKNKADIELEVQGTITGTWDAAKNPKLAVSFYFGEASAIDAPPKRGSFVLVLVERKERGYFIPSAFTPFMPDRAAIAVVDGFDDTRVVAVREKLREWRSKESPDVQDVEAGDGSSDEKSRP